MKYAETMTGPKFCPGSELGNRGNLECIAELRAPKQVSRVDACPRAGKKERTFFFDFTASTAVVDKHVRCLSFFF